MSSPAPLFFQQPFRYLKWVSYNKPTYFYSICIGLAGPGMLVVVPPVRRYLGYENKPRIPQTYPVPKGPRQIPEGFDDE